MYRPKHFDVEDLAPMHGLIREHPFGTLVSTSGSGLVANPLPFLLDPAVGGAGSLFGHVARANPQWQEFDGETETLVLFQGPHAYVSPAWMESEASVPTWNYTAVHAYGCPRVIEDPMLVRAGIDRLVRSNESFRTKPWTTEDAPAEFVEGMLRGIVAFDLKIDRLEGKWKLSQNKGEADCRAAIAGLEAEGGTAATGLAACMREVWD